MAITFDYSDIYEENKEIYDNLITSTEEKF